MKWFFAANSGGMPLSDGFDEVQETIMSRPAKARFMPDRIDRFVAMAALILGFFFVRWVFLAWQGWGVAVFTLGYCLTVALYMMRKGVAVSRAGWFWLAATAAVGVSYGLYDNQGLEPWRSLFLFCAAVYSVLSASGRLILGRTANWMLLDGINGVLVIPFRNFANQYKSLAAAVSIRGRLGKQLASIFFGLLLALGFSGMVLPLLMKADGGGFLLIIHGLYEYYNWILTQFSDLIFQGILAIPVAAYIFGLTSGCAHDLGCKTFKSESVRNTLDSLRVLMPATLYTALGLTCLLYGVFIGSQLSYFFSAFAGQRPEGWLVYSEYARSGFFELCQIAAINLSLLVLANLFSKRPRQEDLFLKILNGLLAMLTLLLIATAFSKMALYIGAYGLSMRRLLPCLFMLFLSIVCLGVIVSQKWPFSILRLAAATGTVMLCVLCFSNPDGWVAGYNADRYLSGTLESYDVEILYRSGAAGVEPALKVFSRTEDQELKKSIQDYLDDQLEASSAVAGTSKDSAQNLHARNRMKMFRAE
jgi:hypothetical protein